jgi:hypothetical protein
LLTEADAAVHDWTVSYGLVRSRDGPAFGGLPQLACLTLADDEGIV